MLKKGATLLVIFFILLTLVIILIPETTKAVSCPVVEIKWAEGQEIQNVDVGPGSSGLVTFAGTVSANLATGYPTIDILVVLGGSTDQGWPVTINPVIIMLNPGTEEKPFSVTVEVPLRTNINGSGLLVVGGEASVYPGTCSYNIPQIKGTIYINQYYQYYMTSYRPSKKAFIGDKIDLNISIHNIGNGIDIFELDLDNSHHLNKNDINVQYKNKFEVYPKETKQSDIFIEISDLTKPGKYELKYILVSVQSQIFEDISQNTNFTFTIFIKNNYYYPISISFVLISIMILVALFYGKMKGRNKSIILNLRKKVRSPKPEPPPRIPPPDEGYVMW
jgi:hypothetical protein